MTQKRDSKCVWLAGASVLAIGLFVPTIANAQEETDDSQRTLSTVTVTTQKTEESIQDVPIDPSAPGPRPYDWPERGLSRGRQGPCLRVRPRPFRGCPRLPFPAADIAVRRTAMQPRRRHRRRQIRRFRRTARPGPCRMAGSILLAQRVVREFGEVRNGVETLEVVGRHIADVFRNDGRAGRIGRVEPAGTVETGVEANSFNAALQKVRAKQRADISVCACE